MQSRPVSTTRAFHLRSRWRVRSSAKSKKSSRPTEGGSRLSRVLRAQNLIGVLVSGALILGLVVSVRPVQAPPAASAASEPPVVESVADSGPDLGSLQDDVGSVLVVSWRGTGIPPGLRA